MIETNLPIQLKLKALHCHSLTISSTPQVTVVATHVVQSADPQRLAAIPKPFKLGPLDHLPYTAVPTDLVWVYEASPSISNLVPLSRLRAASSLLLDYYPQLTGRLSVDASNGLRTITRLGSGIILLEATCNVPLSSFRDAETGDICMYSLPGSGKALIAPWDPSPEGVARDPQFTIQHTRFQCGSVAIGIRISHVLCAAAGALRLFQDLAEIYRKTGADGTATTSNILEQPPHILPYMADETTDMSPEARAAVLAQAPPGFSVEPVTETLAADANATVLGSTEAGSKPSSASPSPRTVGCTLHFSAAELAALKAAATPPDGSSWVSTFEALSAHLWQCTHKARVEHAISQNGQPPPPTQQSAFFTSIDFSSKLNLPPNYFPNATVPCIGTLPSSDLTDLPLWRVAQHVHSWVCAITPGDAHALAAWTAAQPDKLAVRHHFPYDRWAFITSAWHAFPLYQGAVLDDDGGPPVLAGPAFTEISLVDGLGIVSQPREVGIGGLDVKFTVGKGVMGRVFEEGGGLRRFRPDGGDGDKGLACMMAALTLHETVALAPL